MTDATDIGILIRGRYEVLETLGAGGEATVVKALDHLHDRPVALKLRHVGSETRRREVLSEAGLLLALNPHPALPLVREDFFDGERYVIVMDWVDGVDLEQLLRSKGSSRIAVASALAYLAQAAEALTYLHAQNPPVIHGDVKPANLILARGGRIKLVDFGLSSTLGAEGSRTGTAGFIAPELREGAPPSRASDVYSLAATAYALLTGVAPPRGPLSEPRGGGVASERLREALSAGLADEPGSRPATPGELVERLRAGWDSSLPTGVMTFLMTDVVGSTPLWESHPAAMADALVRHEELIAEVVQGRGGRFVTSGDGDATTSVFESAAQAVRAAIDIAHGLAGATWPDGAPIRTRFGLHTGEAEKRAGAYFGTAINLAARVRGQARGGEILLSERTATLAGAGLPRGYSILDLGPHTLRGIKLPQRLCAVAGAGLASSPAASECPYRGLLAFRPSDRHLFFGRERVLDEVLERLARGRLLALVGASGSGKSSLLRAGVIAAVQAGEISCARWARLITPGPEPPSRLEGSEAELLVVDQFEELYTQCTDLQARVRFVDALLAWRGALVIGVRADFYGEISGDARLARAVAANQVLLGPMGEQELRRAIEEPARLAGLELEPGLVELVLGDAPWQPGTLPLISHALRETWERRDGRCLSVKAYRETGGVTSAVAQSAEAIVQSTPEEQRPLLRATFLRLTELGEGAEDTRRRVRSDDLVPHGTDPAIVRALLERLAEARLVTLDEGTAEVAHEVLIRRWPRLRRWLEEDREGIRLYRRLREAARAWNSGGREPADLYRGARLEAALEWGRFNAALLNETESAFLESSAEESERARRRRQVANRRLRRALATAAALLVVAVGLLAFALLSRHDAVSAEASARSQALATESEAQVARDPQLALLLARAALASAATPQAELAASEALDANTARAQLPPLGVQACDSSDYLVLLDAGHVGAADTCSGDVVFADLVHDRILRRIHVGPTTTQMVLAPGGHALIVAAGRNLVSVDLRTGRTRKLFSAPFEIEQVAGPPGHFLAIADRELICLVDLRNHTMRVLARADASVNAVNGIMPASPNTLLIASTGQSVGRGELLPRLTALNVDTGARSTVALVASPRIASVIYLRVSPDERTWYVTGSTYNGEHNDQVATTWAIDARSRTVRWVATGPDGARTSPVQVSPDGRLVAVGYSTGAADVLDAANGDLVARDSSSSPIASGDLAIAAGDKKLVTLSLDGLIRTWSAHGSERLVLQAPRDASISFTPDGRDIVMLGSHGEIVNRAGRILRRYPGFAADALFNYCSSCFSATAALNRLTYLDPGSQTPRVIEIDGRTGRRLAAVTVARMESQGVAPDGRIATAYVQGDKLQAQLIEPSGGAHALAPGATEIGCIAGMPSFTPDSTLMAIGDGCVHVDVWNTRTGRVVRTFVVPEHANGDALITPEGRYVLLLTGGSAFVRASLQTGRIQEMPGSKTPATALAVSPNGRYYAVGHEDGTVDEYDARTLQLIRQHELQNPIASLVFSPDSGELAVQDTNDVVRVWDSCEICENPARLARLAEAESVESLTAAERATFAVP